MKRPALVCCAGFALAALTLSACKREDERAAAGESADAFASRVGGAEYSGNSLRGNETWLPPFSAAGKGSAAAIPSTAADDNAPRLEAVDYGAGVDLGPTNGGCAFQIDDAVMFIAAAPDDASSTGRGVVTIDGQPRPVVGTMSGGPDYIESGPQMTDGVYVVEVIRAAGEPQETAEETYRWSASMTVQQGTDGPLRNYDNGTWTCGL